MRRALAAILVVACLAVRPATARAQGTAQVTAQGSPPRAAGRWVGVGAIGRTAMFMDTTSIERDGAVRRVWMESIDPEPTTFVVGSDTTRFDTVAALHVFDCHAHTHAVAGARYYLGGVEVTAPRPADTTPERLRPGTFMAAVAADLCSERRSR